MREEFHMTAKKDICDFTLEELKEAIRSMGEAPHRANQIFLWINDKHAGSFTMMTDLPKELIKRLEENFLIGRLVCAEHLTSGDGAEKFLWELRDGEYMETVLIKEKNRRTLCLSTQVGCRFKCPFCASGMKGFKRNLTASEITGQVLSVRDITGARATNIVFMGMGEPLDNYENLMRSIRIINCPGGMNIGSRKITISTCGIVPGILKLKSIGLQVELSISLHAVKNDLRDELVPVNRKYPLNTLIRACKEYYKSTKRIITLEYTLIKGVNDSDEDAKSLAGIASGIKAKVNLIGYNIFSRFSGESSGGERTVFFKRYLYKKGITATIRKSRGGDILAACGQLAAARGSSAKRGKSEV